MNGFDKAAGLTTGEWAAFLAGDIPFDGLTAPPLPPAELQRSFVGAAGVVAFREAGLFYDRALDALEAGGHTDIGPTLDFGVGWGRIYRMFLRNCQRSDLIGVDVDPACVTMCRDAMPYGTFVHCAPLPPLPFPAGSFQTVVAYSVFSHLAEDPLLDWLVEFRRLLQPGGRVFFTTLKMAHLGVWEQRQAGELGPVLEQIGFDAAEWREHAERGRHLFVPTGGGGVRDPSFYGEAIVSQAYLEHTAPPLRFELVDFHGESLVMPQAFVELRAV